jgi:HEAT repeats
LKILKERASSDPSWGVRWAGALARNWRDDPDTVKILKERATSDEQEHVRKGAVQELLRGWSEDIDVTDWLARIGNIR